MTNRVDKAGDIHTRLIESAKALRAYAGSDVSRHMLDMLDALNDSYLMDVLNVSPEGLPALQAAIKQTQSIRDIVADEGQDLPKI